uniref:Uncharacterized protein n=1 Tax=Salix viminalis TaxID=40686 RepID=A0A6N2NHD2_SALVM
MHSAFSFGSDCAELAFTRRWPSCFRIIRSTRKAPTAPLATACARAKGKTLLRGKAAKEIPVTPTKTAIGAAVAAACPGFGALYTNYKT